MIIPWRRGGTWERVPVAIWCSAWIYRMRGGLVHHTIMILLRYLSRCCEVLTVGRAPTIFQNDWFDTRMSPESPFFFSLQSFRLLESKKLEIGKKWRFYKINHFIYICVAVSAAKFWKHYISSAFEKAFPVFFVIFLVAQLSPKIGFWVQKNSLASCQRYRHSVKPRALTCLSNIVIWLLGHFWFDTPHINSFEGASVLSSVSVSTLSLVLSLSLSLLCCVSFSHWLSLTILCRGISMAAARIYAYVYVCVWESAWVCLSVGKTTVLYAGQRFN